ncbi:MAG: hypothetical protein V1885_01080 [Candidatus Brennerbacteria bacterium]
MREIKEHGAVVAVVLDGTFEEGTRPLTEGPLALQIIALKHPKGKKLVAHAHRPTERTTQTLVEALMVFSGLVEVTVYNRAGAPLEKVKLSGGQGVLIVDGGIGIEVVEDAEMMEFKNGPFVEDKIVLE